MTKIDDSKELKVSAIQNGTVLDHIPSNQLFRVIDILKLNESSDAITFGINLDSKSMVNKGIIKIANRFFCDNEINMISLIAPNASVNIIHDFKVAEKKIISLPEKVTGIVKCMNPACVTNHQNIETQFTTTRKNNKIGLVCRYCEKITEI
ncbi:MAG: aspartate carbamoyltransferase regulatory subunit [Bacteroidales bacterium]